MGNRVVVVFTDGSTEESDDLRVADWILGLPAAPPAAAVPAPDDLQRVLDVTRRHAHWKESWASPLLEALARKAGAS